MSDHIKAKVDKAQLDAFLKQFDSIADEMVDAGVGAARVPLHRSMKEVMGSGGGGVIGKTAKGRNIYQAAPPGAPPGVRTGHLRRSIQSTEVVNHSATVGTNLEYGKVMEYGSKDGKIAARPWLHRSLNLARAAMNKAIIGAMTRKLKDRISRIGRA